MKLRLLCGFLFIVAAASAQDNIQLSEPHNKSDSLRDLYINTFPNHFFLYPVIKQRSLNFELEKSDRSERLTFKPNNAFSLGVGTYLFEVGFELTFAVPIDEKTRELYGQSKARDIQFNVLAKKWGLDLFYQKYNGFYVTEKGNPPASGMPYPQRPDIDTHNIGITGHYVFNNQKFSFRSVYNFSERQLYSKGSFLLFSSLTSFKLGADASILNDEQKVEFGGKVSFTNLRYTSLSIAPGYTYSVIFKNFFLNGTLSVGPSHHWIYYKLETGKQNNEIAINSFVAARLAIGYNGNRLFGGLSFITQGSNVRFENVRFSNNNGTFKILLGYRFREFGILRKRAWDFIPYKLY